MSSAIRTICVGLLLPLAAQAGNFKPAHLDVEQRLQWQVGKAVFDKLWVAAPSSTKSSDGLGPLYNARSCQQCHERSHLADQPTIHPEISFDAATLFGPALVLKFGRDDINTPDRVYGHQLQSFAVTGMSAEGSAQVRYHARNIGGENIWQPVWSVSNPQHDTLDINTQLSPRLATPLVGIGWLDLISEADIIALSDPDDDNRDGISGRPNRIGTSKVIGRFGWKAGQATLAVQALQALNFDIGISNVLFASAHGDCTESQKECLRRTEHDGLPEAFADMTEALLYFLQHLPAPEAPHLDPEATAGQQLFHTLQCSACHHPEFTPSANVRITPYSDLLLHDMGAALSDGLREHSALAQEWRTPPLWGIGRGIGLSVANQMRLGKRSGFMHDGRARSLHEAILHHAGEADASRSAYQQLIPSARAHLIRFLESL